ncbi:MAG: carbohydrate-binding domain-containing protein [Pseudomonadota bacterium]
MADFNGTAGNDAIQPFGSSLLLTLSGSPAEGGINPLINVLVNGQVLVSGLSITANHAAGATQTVSVPIPAGVTPSTISLQYTNDEQLSYANDDRNLYVSSITLNGTVLPVTAATYFRTADSTTVQGQAEMVWGGNLTYSGAVVSGATVHTGGTVSVDGAGGIDTVFLSNAKASYSVSSTASGYTVAGNGETATLANVERLHFSDLSLALDMTGHAGTVAKIISAVFGQSFLGNEQYVGIGLHLADSGVSASQIASLAVSLPLFTQLAGSASNADFVKYIYHNVIGSDPSASQLNTFVGILESGTSRADLAVMASETSFNEAHLVGLNQTGIEYI